MAVVAWKTVISDPDLISRYSRYLKTRKEGVNRARIIKTLERQLSQVFGGSARGGSAKLVPDISIDDERFTAAIENTLGISAVSEAELKLKRGGRRTTIGQSGVTGLLKTAALQTFGEAATDITKNRASQLNANKGFLLFNALRSDPALFKEFYNKSKFLSIARQIGNGSIELLNILIPEKDFKVPPLSIRYSLSKETIYLSLDDTFEKGLLEKLSTAPAVELATLEVEEFIESFNKLKFGQTKLETTAKKDNKFSIQIPTGGSIPLSRTKARVAKKKQQDLKLSTISDAQMTALVQRETEKRMPKGPLRGPPLSASVLTYRTGRFVDSIKVIQDFRQQLIKYYYAPNYRVHEKRGARAPRFLLQGSIRDTVQAVYGERFRIIRGF